MPAERQPTRTVRQILSFLQIRPEDGPSALLFGAYIALAVGSAVLLTTYNDASFLAVYDATVLPYLFIASALALSATSILYQGLSQRLPRPRLTLLTPLFFGIALVAVRLLEELPLEFITFAAYLVIAVICGLLLIVSWSYLVQAFDTRQLKRLMPIFSTAAAVGAIAGGGSARFLANTLGTENLPLVAAVAFGFLVALTAVGNRRLVAEAASEEEKKRGLWETTRAGVDFIARHPLVRLLTLMLVSSVIVKILVDYQFKTTLKSLYDREGMAAFLGSYYAAASVLTLALQLFLSGRLVARFGIAPALASRPVAVTVLCLASLVHPSFWAYVAIRFSDEVLNRSWYKAGTWLAMAPIPAPRTARVKLTQEGMLEPLVVILTSALLLLLTRVAGLAQLSWVVLGSGLLWLLLGLRVRKTYVAELGRCLDKRLFDFESATALGAAASPDTLDYLARQLRERNPESVVFALRAAREMEVRELADEVKPLLADPDVAIRSAAATTLVTLLGDAAADALRRQLEQEEAAPALAHLLLELAACDDEASLERAFALAGHESLEVRGAAIVLLFKRGGLDGIITAAEQLGRLRQGTNAERATVARILGVVGVRHLDRTLIPLLRDPSQQVRRAALRAASAIPSPAVVAAVAEMVDEEELPSEVEAALIAGKKDAWRTLLGRIEAQPDSVSLKRAAARVAAAVPSVADPGPLLAWLEAGDAGVRHEAQLALSSVRKMGLELDQGILASTFRKELRLALTIDALRSLPLEGAPREVDRDLLDRELGIRLSQTQERLFEHLALRHTAPDVYNAYLGVTGSDRRLRANALEYLDTILHDPGERLLVAHLEATSATECYKKARETLELPALGPHQWAELGQSDPSLAILLGGRGEDHGVPSDTLEAALQLSRVPLLSTQSFENLCRLASLAGRRWPCRGETLFERGEPAEAAWVLTDGSFEDEAAEGSCETVSPGASAGLLAALAGADHDSTLRCLSPGPCLVIERAPLRELLQRYSSVAMPLIAALVAETRRSTDREAQVRLLLKPTTERGDP